MELPGSSQPKPETGKEQTYERLLTEFGAVKHSTAECIQHLTSLGYSKSQARSAVYRFRQRHGLLSRPSDSTPQ